MLIKNKKGVSILIGYVLLVVFAVIIGAIIFIWLKTYVPAQGLSCPDGVSVFMKELTFNDSNLQLNLSLKNNGRFDIAGYFIHATNSSSQELPTIDLSPYLNENYGGKKFGNSVIFGEGEDPFKPDDLNLFKPGDQRRNIFDIPSDIGEPYSIRIIPTRFQEEKNRERFVSCGEARTEQLVGEPFIGTEEPICGNNIIEGTEQCDDGNTNNGDGCSSSCTTEIPPACDNDNQIDPGEFCDGTNLNGKNCQSQGFDNGTLLCNNQCGFDTSGCFSCGDGVINTGEECDDGNTVSGDGCSSQCITEFCGDGITNGAEQCDDGNTNDNDACRTDCTFSPSTDCSNNCISQGSSWGYCTTVSECSSAGGTNPFSGNQFCGAQQGRCCCIP